MGSIPSGSTHVSRGPQGAGSARRQAHNAPTLWVNARSDVGIADGVPGEANLWGTRSRTASRSVALRVQLFKPLSPRVLRGEGTGGVREVLGFAQRLPNV